MNGRAGLRAVMLFMNVRDYLGSFLNSRTGATRLFKYYGGTELLFRESHNSCAVRTHNSMDKTHQTVTVFGWTREQACEFRYRWISI